MKELLFDLHFNIVSVGFDYWLYAIELYKKNRHKYSNSMSIIYNEVALKYKTTKSRVERAMRHSRETAEKQIKKQYGYKDKITNQVVLELICNFERKVN